MSANTPVYILGDARLGRRSMLSAKKLGLAALAAVTIAGSTLAMTGSADARGFGRGGGFHGGRGFGVGAGIATGLAFGALGAGYAYGGYPGYGYGGYPGYGAYAYDDDYGGGCELRRRVRYTPYGPVVRHVRVCY
jgi:hypothetical protein